MRESTNYTTDLALIQLSQLDCLFLSSLDAITQLFQTLLVIPVAHTHHLQTTTLPTQLILLLQQKRHLGEIDELERVVGTIHTLILPLAARRQVEKRRSLLVPEILSVEGVHVELVFSSQVERANRFHHVHLRLLFLLRSLFANPQNLLNVFILRLLSFIISTVNVPFSEANILSAP